MADPIPFRDRAALFAKLRWEGGVIEALEHGITARDMPKDDPVLQDAWAQLDRAWALLRSCVEEIQELDPGRRVGVPGV